METNKREWQLFELTILDKIVSICEKYHLRYYLSSGTLLGAVRHKGFIPWDDDIDIDLPISDYKKFLKVAPKELEMVGCFLQTYKTDPAASLSWAMVRANNTTSLPVSCYKWNIHWGVHVDIFPIIGLYSNKLLRDIQFKMFGFSRTLLEKDYIDACLKDFVPSLKIRLLYRIPRKIRHMIVGLINLYVDRDFDYYSEGSVKWWKLKSNYRSDFYKDSVKLEFEGKLYNAPADYDSELKLLYGDYMTPPPENERIGHEMFQGDTIRDIYRDYKLYQIELGEKTYGGS